MSATENDVLIAAHRRALTALSDGRDEAQRGLYAAQQEAMEVLFKQQEAAARLLLEREDVAAALEHAEDLKTVGESDESRHKSRTERNREAAFLLEKQRQAAAMLEDARATAADKLARDAELVSADILLAAQERAASILLDARKQILDGRQSGTKP